ncbi:hypothetical protein KDW_39360 [Dictyobacter vulcani]|uniref:Uncharacterized protein n=1 Tax=Dictyobacter vulcani TaxID=2607529 RepID=A0A5J4KJV4_9CHLR|nr:hypothetical protein KDW_39360 [Dictyobacter vulcani]
MNKKVNKGKFSLQGLFKKGSFRVDFDIGDKNQSTVSGDSITRNCRLVYFLQYCLDYGMRISHAI